MKRNTEVPLADFGREGGAAVPSQETTFVRANIQTSGEVLLAFRTLIRDGVTGILP